MKRSKRLWVGGIALFVIILLTLLAAPSSSKINSGSTYNRAPDGYGAWYAFMQKQGVAVARWQKPFPELYVQKRPITLLQVNSYTTAFQLDSQEQKWIEKGNNLVILGVYEQVTAAEFSTMQKSLVGDIKIDTTRRRTIATGEKASLSDRFGAIVWEKQYGKGKVVFSTTPHLAANAYQNNISNFQYLADLVKEKGKTLLVDEYIHGYKDNSVKQSEREGNLLSYLAKTPLFPALLQLSILLLTLIWALNRRFEKPVALKTPIIDNSEAYILALAGVLQKAESRDFVIEMVGKEEQKQLQKALLLGQEPLDNQTIINAWIQQTGNSATELEAVLNLQSQKHRISEKDLINWLQQWQTLRVEYERNPFSLNSP
ncbi:DUF4350 domain-containing protein [Iningainema tapete]|uniref:DUF4350 domain-containing protein n=1 Tax=Iningainema tapete BLCC-T55 TaxID=2748662 RepID=A0A8J7CBH6_9CYAN|nr:DUF4350 domain-containing protein [Iningainema tapete]MBD2778366.1 DUF4350 domain-containing protein [Iningainema tapete BLCC-T55]